MPTKNIPLPDQMQAWVKGEAETGHHGNASDESRDPARSHQQRQHAIAALQSAITEGVESGEPQPFDAAAFRRRTHGRHAGP